jgi:hypothetical protein
LAMGGISKIHSSGSASACPIGIAHAGVHTQTTTRSCFVTSAMILPCTWSSSTSASHVVAPPANAAAVHDWFFLSKSLLGFIRQHHFYGYMPVMQTSIFPFIRHDHITYVAPLQTAAVHDSACAWHWRGWQSSRGMALGEESTVDMDACG